MAQLGIEVTRRRLPELAAAANRGVTTVITKHGQPYAALGPIAATKTNSRLPMALMALKGCAAGLWGKNPAGHVHALRDEWQR